MARRQHSLRNQYVREPSVLTHATASKGFAISPREILEMNQDGLTDGNMVGDWWSVSYTHLTLPTIYSV